MPAERRAPPTTGEARRAGRTPRPAEPGSAVERLQKTLAKTGFGSRRAAEELIRAGRVTVGAREAVRKLTQGVELDDGVARALRVGRIQRTGARSALELVMVEGRKREVRRMLAAVGFPVWRLVRVRVGPVGLGRIRPGGVRPLDPDEVMALYRVTGMRRA